MTVPPFWLTAPVTAIAFLYASVGFGGATGYLAVMSQFEIEPDLMASTALILNVIVAGISFVNFRQAGHLNRRLTLPFVSASIPAAFLGGAIKLAPGAYFILLYSVLTYVMLRMLFACNDRKVEADGFRPPPLWLALACGGAIGLLSGLVGIGGGILLSPIIILARWGNPKQASSTAAAFILLNSISGLLGRFIGGNFMFGELGVWLLPAGILGALAGSYLGARRFSGLWTRRTLGVVLLIAVVRFWVGYLG